MLHKRNGMASAFKDGFRVGDDSGLYVCMCGTLGSISKYSSISRVSRIGSII